MYYNTNQENSQGLVGKEVSVVSTLERVVDHDAVVV
jgi:hypothetical protein